MSKSILTIDTPKGCVFCPLAKMHGFNAFHNYSVKQECVMDRQPYMGITCPFCNGIRYIYNLTDDEVLTYKHEECPLAESEEEQEPKSPCDVCRFNPPGIGDGKPCTMCPAKATERFREKVKSEYFRRRKEV